MIFAESPATLLVMIALLEVGPGGATREHLVKKAAIGTTTFYRVMKPLLERNVVTQQGPRYYLPMSAWYNFRFKLWHDAERLYQLTATDRGEVIDIMDHARHALGDSLLCLWLVGSAAHSTLLTTSDFDFLAVVKERTLYHPTATRDVNFVTLTEAEFRDLFDGRDAFLLSAVHYGIILFDRDFAQPYCATAVTVETTAQKLHEADRAMEHQRKRFFTHLEDGDLDLAAGVLKTMAVTLTRIILQSLGELPAGKPELLDEAEVFLGNRYHRWLRNVLSGQHDKKRRLIDMARQWSNYRDQYLKSTSHLKSFASLPHARGFEFENQCVTILQELLPKAQMDRNPSDPGADVVLTTGEGVTYLVQCKSLERQIDVGALDKMRALTREHARHHHAKMLPVLVVNAWRSLPVMERSEMFTPTIRSKADKAGVHLLSGVDLLRAHNMLHIEETSPHQAWKQLLSGDLAPKT